MWKKKNKKNNLFKPLCIEHIIISTGGGGEMSPTKNESSIQK